MKGAVGGMVTVQPDWGSNLHSLREEPCDPDPIAAQFGS